MKAILLAAGYGTRLQPLTHYVPKPLVPILGRPLLQHMVAKLQTCHVTGIGINVHHRAGMIEAFLREQAPGLPVCMSPEETIMGVAGGIGKFRRFLEHEDCFLVHNGDILSNIDLDRVIAAHRKERPICTMVLHDDPRFNNVSIDNTAQVVDIRQELHPDSAVRSLAYTGIAIMQNELLAYFPDKKAHLMPILIDIIKTQQYRVQAYVAAGCAWQDVGTPAHYFEAHKYLLLDRKPLVAPSYLPREPIGLGPGTVVEEGAQLRGFLSAGNNCLFEKGSLVENAVIWDNTVVPQGVTLKNVVAGNGWVVNV